MGICLKFSENYRKLERGNRVILTNRDSGEWIKISKECISIIERGIYNKLNSEELLKCIEDRDRKSTRLNSSHIQKSRMPSSA